jgi:hypothetical protein
MIRAFAVIAGLLVATMLAGALAVFLETDSCIDAGGIYIRATGACSLPAGVEYVAQFARPGLYALWGIFLVLIGLPAWMVYRIIIVLAARFSGRTEQKLRGEG